MIRAASLGILCGAVTILLGSAVKAQNAQPPFVEQVDMKTLMEHVLTPAATKIWEVNAVTIDVHGEHDLGPKSNEDWENLASASATLAEATNALMIPQRQRNAQWNDYAGRLADIAKKAYIAAEAHDLKSISEVSDTLDSVCAACHHHFGLE
jgi:hypothetical protein